LNVKFFIFPKLFWTKKEIMKKIKSLYDIFKVTKEFIDVISVTNLISVLKCVIKKICLGLFREKSRYGTKPSTRYCEVNYHLILIRIC